MRRLTTFLERNALYVALAVLTVVIGAELARPFQSASIAFDSQSTVLFFDRIVTGQRLEAYVSTTPKPLMSVIFGTLQGLTHDWRSLAWLTLAVDVVAIVATAALVFRVAGIVAAAFVGVGLANNASLLFDVGYALATPYALLALAAAGLAVSRTRPRYVIAGICLCLAVLARVETLVLVGVLTMAVGGWWLWAWRSRGEPPPLGAWLVPGVGYLAIPVMMVHDALMTGDALNWAHAAADYSNRHPGTVGTPIHVLGQLGERYFAVGGVSLLALVGLAWLVLNRRYWLATALVALGPGVGAFLVLLAFRHIVVPIRYAAVIDIAVIFAAGIGLTQLSIAVLDRAPIVGWVTRLRGRRPGLLAAVAAGAVAIVLMQPYFLADPTLRMVVRRNLNVSIAEDRAIPVIRAALATACPVPASGYRLTVPGSVLPRVSVDLGMSLLDVGGTAPGKIDLAAGYPARCQIVLHIRDAEAVTSNWSALEVSQPTQMGGVTVEPLLADPTAGVWVVAIR